MDSKSMNVRAKPLSLKDYLLDDLSSCSSNGFRSFPRRQCCTTVRYLLDIELKNQRQQQHAHLKKNHPPDLPKSPARSALSAFQYVITAVKRLPFAAGRLSDAEKLTKSMLVRRIPKKIIKNTTTFLRRNPKGKGIGRLKSFDELLKEDPANHIASPAAQEACSSEFPVGENDVVEVPLKDKKASNGETMGDGSTTSNTDGSGITITNSKEKQWSNEEKEQLSPVSVLDCPFDDEDDEVSSPFRHGVAHLEGTNKKLLKKIQRSGSLSEFEPLNLTERFASQPESDKKSPEWPQQCPYKSNADKYTSEMEQKEDEEEDDDIKALKLLHEFKQNHPSYGPKVKVDNLVLDFFREQITNERGRRGESSFAEELLKEVEAWINGQLHEPFLGWDVKANRQSYINDMEKDGTWKTTDQENTEVAFELETEIFHGLLNEICETKLTF